MKSTLGNGVVLFLFSILFSLKLVGQDFEVAPVILDFTSEPGDNQTKLITVKNHSNAKASFVISLADFLPTSLGGKIVMAPNSTKRSCANWLNINPTFFELNPGDEIPIQVGMLVPNDQYGTAWCMLYIQPSREQTSWSADKNLATSIIVSGRIGILIYQSPKSNTNHSLKISNMTEVSKFGSKERTFSATIENLGDKITKCKVYLTASNIKTSEEKQFKFMDFETFPKMTRTVELNLPDKLPAGKYSLAIIIDYGAKYSLEGTQMTIDVNESKTEINISIPQLDSLKNN